MKEEDKPKVEVETVGHVDHRPRQMGTSRATLGMLAALAAMPMAHSYPDELDEVARKRTKDLHEKRTPFTEEAKERKSKAEAKRARKAEKFRLQQEKQEQHKEKMKKDAEYNAKTRE